MKSLRDNVAELAKLIQQNQTLAAMEKFYADDIIMQENETPPRIGKAICLEHERRMLASTTDFNATLMRQAIDESNGVVFSEWQYTFTNSSGQRFSLTEVAVQQWDKELIQAEKFYYNKAIRID